MMPIKSGKAKLRGSGALEEMETIKTFFFLSVLRVRESRNIE